MIEDMTQWMRRSAALHQDFARYLRLQRLQPTLSSIGESRRNTGSDYSYNYNGFLVRSFNNLVQRVISGSLQAHLLHIYHYPDLARYPTNAECLTAAMGGILAWHGQGCIHNRDRLPRMRTQPSEYDDNATFETPRRRLPAPGHGHGHTQSAAIDNEWEAICGDDDQSIFQALRISSKIENRRYALCIHDLRQLNRIIWDTHYLRTYNGTRICK